MLLSEDGLQLRNRVREFADQELSVRVADYAVPLKNRMSGEGEGFRQTLRVLRSSRIAIAQAAYESAVGYAKRRAAFARHLADLQAIQFMMADMATNIDAARLQLGPAATLKDLGQAFVKEASTASLSPPGLRWRCPTGLCKFTEGWNILLRSPWSISNERQK